MSEKPEWFEITEGDQKPAEIKPKRSLLKIAAVALPLVVVGTFAVGANGEEDDAPNVPHSIESTNSSSSNASTQNDNTSVAESPKTSTPSTKVTAVTNPITSTPEKPGIGVQPPKGDGDDDHEGFEGGEHKRFDGDNHEGREHHREGGEREGRASAPKIPQPGTSTSKN
jgi:hypothetical protein